MTPSQIRATVVAERISWIRKMTGSIENLPIADYDQFLSDPRNCAAAESYLRRAIEALLDLSRHILSKGFAIVVTEYKDIGIRLSEEGVLTQAHGATLRKIAGYRNRMVHFYHEVSQKELYQLCTTNMKDIGIILEALVSWIQKNSDKTDREI